jgi:hypothetical protein
MKTSSMPFIPLFMAMFLCASHPLLCFQRWPAEIAAGQARSGQGKLSISDDRATPKELNEKQGPWLQRHGTKLLAAALGLAIGIAYGRRKQAPKAG